jgi:hypothetical protein
MTMLGLVSFTIAKRTWSSTNDMQPSEAEQMDALDLLEAVDVVPLFPSNFHEQIASTKWKDKVELLADCLKVLEGKPKIVDNPDLSSYASALAAKMKDVNVLVVSNSAAMIAALASGVEHKGFGRYRNVVMPPILERLKEKKTMDALGNTLDAVFSSVSLMAHMHMSSVLMIAFLIDNIL